MNAAWLIRTALVPALLSVLVTTASAQRVYDSTRGIPPNPSGDLAECLWSPGPPGMSAGAVARLCNRLEANRQRWNWMGNYWDRHAESYWPYAPSYAYPPYAATEPDYPGPYSRLITPLQPLFIVDTAVPTAESVKRVQELRHMIVEITSHLGPELTFEEFRGSVVKLDIVRRQVLQKPETRVAAGSALYTLSSAVDSLVASEDAWRRERVLEADIEQRTKERDAALADYGKRVRGELSVAQERLRRAIEYRDRAKEERISAWATAERVAKALPRLAEEAPKAEGDTLPR
jgi:hypothetical protein